MYYEFDWTVPANTPETAPVKKRVELKPGILTEVRIWYPPGCQGLAKVRIFDGTHMLRPKNPDGWIKGDGSEIRVPVWLLMDVDPYPISFHLANIDELFEHTLTISIPVLPRELAFPGKLESEAIRALAAGMGIEIPEPKVREIEPQNRS